MDKYLSTKTITLAGTMRRINLPPMRCITPPPMVEARLTSPLSPPTFPTLAHSGPSRCILLLTPSHNTCPDACQHITAATKPAKVTITRQGHPIVLETNAP